ncbi:MAG: response regulator transcription factor [Tenericutes bacterium]|nr:response regulator transcription factor [Mycoplasmatota bacterium]
MLHITICDDSKEEIENILKLLEGFSFKKEEISINTFNSSMDLIKSIENGKMSDIYLLDIVMPGLSGIDIGTIIRQKKGEACIIFFTNSTEFALNAYKISALQYLLKPVDKSILYDALHKAIHLIEKADKIFVVDTPLGKTPLKYKEIIYIEYVNHAMNFYTRNGVITSKSIRIPFTSALEEILDSSHFILPHRAFLVNMKHIKVMTKNTFIMRKLVEIPISKNRFKYISNLYFNYLLSEENKHV